VFVVGAACVVGLHGCSSAGADLAPSTPEAAAAPLPESVTEVAGPEHGDAATPTEPTFADTEIAGIEAAGEPEQLETEALELCQRAEERLDRGETDEALAALDQAYALMLQLPGNGDGAFLQGKEDIRLLVADLIDRIYQSGRTVAATPAKSWDLEMPIVHNEHVQREIKSLTTVEREAFLAGYTRAGRYRPMILAKLEEAGLPSQLSWLPLVESWFKERAYSRASAVGIWQFISSTGLRYGLTRDAWIDERYDPEKATDAAIGYLTDLHGLFGDWPKALAGYNCGEARVQRLQRRSAGEFVDFWDLYLMLPKETRRYVPRLIAALLIIDNPAQYGVTLPEPEPPLDGATRVEIKRPVKLASLDTALGLPTGTLALLNPELRHKSTPKRSYALRVPSGQGDALLAKIGTIPEWKEPVVEYATHRVRSGETLGQIARRYRTSISAIMRSNRIKSANRIWPGQRLKIPGRAGSAPDTPPIRTSTAVDGKHTVRRGDSLHIVARRYGTSVAQLKRDNGLSSNLIHPGQVLKVGSTKTASAGTASADKRYQVSSGDTLGAIATHHGVALTSLLDVNGLTPRSRIYPGQWLTIP
jgi:membrane-bound lytic murein transglycosylase D